MAKLAETFHQCLRVSYGITKGIGYGLKNVVQDTIERGVLPQPVMIAKNLAQTFQLIAALSQTENLGEAIGKAYDEFRQLPLEKQAEHITTIIATFLIPVPGKISSVIDSTNKTLTNVGRIVKKEAAGLELLLKIEGATLKPGQVISGVRATQAPFMAACQSAIKTVAKGVKVPGIIGKAESSASSSLAHNVNAKINLNKKMSALQDAQKKAVKVQEFPDGRIRYYEAERAPRNAGPTRGSSHVTEFNPKTGQVRAWSECYDHNGNVNRVNPKMIDGQQIKSHHYPLTKSEIEKLSKKPEGLN